MLKIEKMLLKQILRDRDRDRDNFRGSDSFRDSDRDRTQLRLILFIYWSSPWLFNKILTTVTVRPTVTVTVKDYSTLLCGDLRVWGGFERVA
jgi:hypothetical protein